MTTRKLYSEELVQLSESLEEMGNLVEASLKNLFFSIENKDMQLAERIVADDPMSTTWSAASKLSA